MPDIRGGKWNFGRYHQGGIVPRAVAEVRLETGEGRCTLAIRQDNGHWTWKSVWVVKGGGRINGQIARFGRSVCIWCKDVALERKSQFGGVRGKVVDEKNTTCPSGGLPDWVRMEVWSCISLLRVGKAEGYGRGSTTRGF